MKRRLFSIPLILSIFATAICSAFSVFYLDGDHNSNKVSQNLPTRLDNIEENYVLDGQGQDSDYFNVSFYPQPRYAMEIQGKLATSAMPQDYDPNSHTESNSEWSISKDGRIRSLHRQYGTNDGYWTDTPDKFLPKTYEKVFKNVTYEQIEEVGIPESKMGDSGDWQLHFTGWTANVNIAALLGYGGQGDYDLFDFMTSLSIIDQTAINGKFIPSEEVENHKSERSIDGTFIGDKQIAIYPIFSTGKDYADYEGENGNQYLEKYRSNAIQLQSMGNNSSYNRYLSRNDTNPDSITDDYYYTTTIRANEGDPNYKISIAPVIEKGWYGSWPSVENILPTDETGKTLQGVYNVYVYLINQFEYQEYNATYPSNGITEIPDCLKDLSVQFTKSFNGTVTGDYDYSDDWWPWTHEYHDYGFYCYVYVERIYEYKVLGGSSSSFDYFNSLNPYLYRKSNQEKNTFISNNIPYYDTDYTFEYHPTGGKRSIYKRNIFTVAAAERNISYSIEIDNSGGDGFIGDALLEKPKIASSEALTDGDYFIFDNTEGTNYSDVLLKFKVPGNYIIRAKAEYSTDPNDGHQISTVKVSAKQSPNNFFVKVFSKDTVLPVDANGFVIHDTTPTLYQAVNVRVGLKLNQLQFIKTGGDSTVYSVKDILQENYLFMNHANGRIVDETELGKFTISKNYIFYLIPKN